MRMRRKGFPTVRNELQPHMSAADTSLPNRASSFAKAVYKFCRPHTIRGTILACFSGVGRALYEQPVLIDPSLIPNAALGLLALLFGNAFIVGINQIFDEDIDKINKPFLPIASGEMSPKAAWVLVISSLLLGVGIVKTCFSPLIFYLYLFGTTIGALYSIPPFTFKRFPLMAGLTIAICRGFLLNFGVYYATREALMLPFKWSPPVSFLAQFMTVFACVIAVTKDLPDVEGDVKYNIDTFAAKFGPKKVATAATAVLLLNYAGAAAWALMSPVGAFNRKTMIVGHGILAAMLAQGFSKLDTTSMPSIKKYYKKIWDVFYLEYVLYPFI